MKTRSQLVVALSLVLLAVSVPAAGGEIADEIAGEGGPWIGVYLVDEVDGGIRIVAVVPGGPAAIAGLRSGDLLIEAGNVEIADQEALGRVLGTRAIDQPLAFQVLREGEPLSVKVTPVSRLAFPGTLVGEAAPPAPSRAVFTSWPGLSRHLGLEVVSLTPELRRHYGVAEDRGVLVVRADEESLGRRAGVEVGDVVVTVAGATITRPAELALGVVRWNRREALRMELIRGRKPVQVELASPAPAPPPDPDVRRHSLEASIKRLEKQIQEMRRQLAELSAQEASPDR